VAVVFHGEHARQQSKLNQPEPESHDVYLQSREAIEVAAKQ
jgi:hypothetical protein